MSLRTRGYAFLALKDSAVLLEQLGKTRILNLSKLLKPLAVKPNDRFS